jgi:hypothetical protein
MQSKRCGNGVRKWRSATRIWVVETDGDNEQQFVFPECLGRNGGPFGGGREGSGGDHERISR